MNEKQIKEFAEEKFYLNNADIARDIYLIIKDYCSRNGLRLYDKINNYNPLYKFIHDHSSEYHEFIEKEYENEMKEEEEIVEYDETIGSIDDLIDY